MQRILAIGGGGFMMEDAPSPIDAYLLALCERERPRVCFVPTPSGDLPEHIEKFYAAFPARRCEPTHLAFFRAPSPRSVALSGFENHMLSQDIVFVGGGNTKSALAVWREWGLDRVLKKALEAGILLSGMSAGAMCWFQQGLTDSFSGSEYRPLDCLGLLAGGCGVHYSGDPKRRPSLHAAVAARAIAPSIAIDDYAAVLYSDGELSRVISWRDDASAYQVSLHDGHVKETRYQPEKIKGAIR